MSRGVDKATKPKPAAAACVQTSWCCCRRLWVAHAMEVVEQCAGWQPLPKVLRLIRGSACEVLHVNPVLQLLVGRTSYPV